MQPPPVETKILGDRAGSKAQEIGLHPVPVGSPAVRKIPIAPPVAEIEIQAKLSSPAETKKMPKDLRARVKETRLGPILQAGARGVAAVEVPPPAAVAVEGAIIAWIRCPVKVNCQVQTEIMARMP